MNEIFCDLSYLLPQWKKDSSESDTFWLSGDEAGSEERRTGMRHTGRNTGKRLKQARSDPQGQDTSHQAALCKGTVKLSKS